MSVARRPLFDPDVPDGFEYRHELIADDTEALLAEEMARLEFSTFEMRGVAARRRVAFFGNSYGRGQATPPLPAFLMPLRGQVAVWANVDAHDFAMALINEYPRARRLAGTATRRSTTWSQASLCSRPVV